MYRVCTVWILAELGSRVPGMAGRGLHPLDDFHVSSEKIFVMWVPGPCVTAHPLAAAGVACAVGSPAVL